MVDCLKYELARANYGNSYAENIYATIAELQVCIYEAFL